MFSPRKNLTFEQLFIYYDTRGLKLNEAFLKNLELLHPKARLLQTVAINNPYFEEYADYCKKLKLEDDKFLAQIKTQKKISHESIESNN